MTELLRGALIGGIFSLLTVILPLLLTRSRRHAETQVSLSDVILKSSQALNITSEQLIEAFHDIKALRDELEEEKQLRRADSERFNKELRRWALYASQLAKQIVDSGGSPVPFPPDSDPKIRGML